MTSALSPDLGVCRWNMGKVLESHDKCGDFVGKYWEDADFVGFNGDIQRDSSFSGI